MPDVDVTGHLHTFRECARHVWNVYFLKVAAGTVNWDIVETFQSIEEALFDALVLHQLPRRPIPSVADEYPFLSIAIDGVRTPIHISAGEGTGRWDQEPHLAYAGDFEFHLIRLWNWYDQGFRDYNYYYVRISSSSKYSHLVGREALIPVSEALKVMCATEAA
jgi:hypothetical protein